MISSNVSKPHSKPFPSRVKCPPKSLSSLHASPARNHVVPARGQLFRKTFPLDCTPQTQHKKVLPAHGKPSNYSTT